MPSAELLEAIAVTAELTSTTLSEPAAKVMAMDLGAYPERQVLGALLRCRRELRGRLTIAEVMARLDDGRPGAEEAWAMLPKSEADSVVWTDEMCQAWAVAGPMIDDDPVAARMAFKETYLAACQKARDAHIAPKWTPSLGHDSRGRERVLSAAVEVGRLTAEHAATLLPVFDAPKVTLLGPTQHQQKLPSPRDTKDRSKELAEIMRTLGKREKVS